jgi:hypothetical protein
MLELQGKTRWAIVLALCFLAGCAAWLLMDWSGYVQGWVGSTFRAASGGAIGWAVSRYVVRLDLSAIPTEQRPLAGLSQALLIAGFAVAVAVGV